MSEKRQLEFFLLRYVPDPVKNEFVNVGVALLGKDSAELRFTADWSRVKCMDPDADTEILEAIEQSLRAELQQVDSRDALLKRIRESFSNIVQLSETKGVLAENAKAEIDELARMYLETRPPLPTERKTPARAALKLRMKEAFQSAGVWGHRDFQTDIAASAYGRKGDPLKIDCGYRNGLVRMFHAVTDADTAKLLAFSCPEMKQGIAREIQKASELTAVFEPSDAEESSFAEETLRRAEIVIASAAQLPEIAERARRELKI